MLFRGGHRFKGSKALYENRGNVALLFVQSYREFDLLIWPTSIV